MHAAVCKRDITHGLPPRAPFCPRSCVPSVFYQGRKDSIELEPGAIKPRASLQGGAFGVTCKLQWSLARQSAAGDTRDGIEATSSGPASALMPNSRRACRLDKAR